MALSSSLSLLRSLVLELQVRYLTLGKSAVSNNPELVVPSLTSTAFFLATCTFASIIIKGVWQVITLETIDSNHFVICHDVDRLINGTLDHLKCHRWIFEVKVNLPDTTSGELQLSKARRCVVHPIIGIISDSATRLQRISFESSIVTANSRNHNLIDISTLGTNSSYEVCTRSFKWDSIVQVIFKTLVGITTSYEVTLVKLHFLNWEVIKIEVSSSLNLCIQIESKRINGRINGTLCRRCLNCHCIIILLPLIGESNVT